jgi:hypothetical protein
MREKICGNEQFKSENVVNTCGNIYLLVSFYFIDCARVSLTAAGVWLKT